MLTKASTFLLGAAVVLAPLMVGTVHATTAAVICLLVILSGSLTMLESGRDGDESGTWVSLIVVGFGVLAAWSAIQLIPLPIAVLEVIQPTAAAMWSDGWELAVGGEVPWRPISLDPTATADRGLRWVALGVAGWAAANLPNQRRWRPLYLIVLAAGAAALLLGFGIRATDPTTLFGLYEPSIGFRGPSPFVSTNHAASFYGICGIVGLGGVALRRDGHPVEASIAGVLGLLFLAMAAVHDSDAVMAALGVAVVVFIAGFAFRTDSGTGVKAFLLSQSGRFLYVGVAALCLVLLGWWLGLFDFLSGLMLSPIEQSESALNRTELALAALSASYDYFIVGSGGGTVDVVAGRYVDWEAMRPASIPVVENDPVEWLLTYGWFFGGLLTLAFVVTLGVVGRRAVSRARGERWIVGAAVLVFMMGIALFHFPFLALGIALPFIVVFEGLTAPRRPPEARGFSKSGHFGLGRRPSLVVLGSMVLLVLFHAFSYQAWTFDTSDEAATMVRTRPTDGRVFAELAGRALQKDDDERARMLARHSAELDGTPDAKVFLARTLGSTGADSEAAGIYAELLDSPVTAGLVRMEWIARDLEEADDRALALSMVDTKRLEGAIRGIRKVSGPEAATETILALSDLREDDPALHRAAVETFVALGAVDLAEMWADSAEERGVMDGENLLGPELKIAVARATRDRDEARRIAAERLDRGSTSDRIALTYLEHLPAVAEATDEETERVGKAVDQVCKSPLPRHLRKPCWLARAWLAEKHGEHDEAEFIFQRIASRLDEPLHFAHFLSRRGECLELQRFKEGLSDERDKKQVGQVAGECRSGSEKLTP